MRGRRSSAGPGSCLDRQGPGRPSRSRRSGGAQRPVAAHARRRVDRLLRGHEHAAALRVVDETVIAAGHIVALERSLRQRHQPMPAGVLERHSVPAFATVEHQTSPGDLARQELALELNIVGRGVPAVVWPVGQLEGVRNAPEAFVRGAVSRCHLVLPRSRRYGPCIPPRGQLHAGNAVGMQLQDRRIGTSCERGFTGITAQEGERGRSSVRGTCQGTGLSVRRTAFTAQSQFRRH